MTTPTPLHADLDELLNGLQAPQGRAVRLAIVRAVHALFDAATARPAPPTPISDTNGSEPEAVDEALREWGQRELLPQTALDPPQPLNGIDPPGRAT